MEYHLRPYQREAVNKLLWCQRFEGADLCVLPTGAGKSLVIAEMAYKLNQPVLILQPSKEILEQNLAKIMTYVPSDKIGVYSASMKRKDFGFITFATIQSIYKKPQDFAHFKQVIIDECHLVNPKNLDGMFTSFLNKIGNPKVIGFTATPYRLDTLYLRNELGLSSHTVTRLVNRVKDRFWHRIAYNIDNAELVKMGYLVPLKYISKPVIRHEDIPTNISKSDFDLIRYEEKIEDKFYEVVESVFFAEELGKSVLVFCSSIEQAERLCEVIPGGEIVTSKTKAKERARIISEFREGKIHTVFNVGVLTTGFDHPSLDCILLLRPTQSIGLYYQMLGRGVRLSPEKTHCKVIDITGTVEKIGRIETIKLLKLDKWELVSEKGSWHNKPLYSFLIHQ